MVVPNEESIKKTIDSLLNFRLKSQQDFFFTASNVAVIVTSFKVWLRNPCLVVYRHNLAIMLESTNFESELLAILQDAQSMPSSSFLSGEANGR